MDPREEELHKAYGTIFVEVIKQHVWRWESGKPLDLSEECFWTGSLNTRRERKLWGYTNGLPIADDDKAYMLGMYPDETDHDKHDKGGETKGGFAQKSHPHLVVRDLTIKDIFRLYYELYATPIRFDELDHKVGVVLFDIGCGSGPLRAVLILQKVLGVAEDGVLGPKTLQAAQKMNPDRLFELLTMERKNFYHRIVANNPKQQVYLQGWLNRSNSLEAILNKF